MDTNDELSKLVEKLTIEHEGWQETHEILSYTKNDDDEIVINSLDGQKQLKFGLGKLNSNKFIGNSLLNGYENFEIQDLQKIYSLVDIFSAMEYSIDHELIELCKNNIVSLRRILLLIMLIPVNKYKDLQFNIIYWKSFIIIDYDWKSSAKTVIDSQYLKLQYSGFKFEQILTSGDYSTRFYTLMNQNLSDKNVFFTAEIDAISQGMSVELKTISKQPSFKHKQTKLISTWCQNKLIGCKHTILGYRSSSFKLSKVQHLTNQQLQHELVLFNKQDSLHCYQQILQQIVDNSPGKDDPSVLQLKYKYVTDDLSDNIKFIPINNDIITNEVVNDIIPKSFQKYIEKS